ncbi:MAG: protein kinase [Deltaproteobacteria bacterium]|nr:protein kinase [Deltaproteobacteria bacterium]
MADRGIEAEQERTDEADRVPFSGDDETIAQTDRRTIPPDPSPSFGDEEATTFEADAIEDRTDEARLERVTDPAPPPPPAQAPPPPNASRNIPVAGLGFAAIRPGRASEPPPDAGSTPIARAASGASLGKVTQGFGRFTLGPPVGAGGMAEVRLGFETLPDKSERACVVKRIAPGFAGRKRYVEMFAEEIRLSRLLEHPNIVRAFDDGEESGIKYIAFELIDGVTLADLKKLAARPIPESVIVEIGIAVVRALGYAHRVCGPDGQPLHLVHRDISPQNVLVSRDGAVKLVDFGIARFEGRAHSTVAGEVKGKMRYMSTEQLAYGEITARTDFFALGIVLAELLDHLQDGLTRHFVSGLRTAPGSMSPDLHRLLLRMTAPKAADRPASAEALLEELLQLARQIRGPTVLGFTSQFVFPKRPPLRQPTPSPRAPSGRSAPRRAASRPAVERVTDPATTPAALGGEDDPDHNLGYADTVMRYVHLMPARPAAGPLPVDAPVRAGIVGGVPSTANPGPLIPAASRAMTPAPMITGAEQSFIPRPEPQLSTSVIWVIAGVMVGVAIVVVFLALR